MASTYEDYTSDRHFDLIFSDCALHWVPKDIAIEQSCKLLAKGGWLVGAWNMPRFSDSVSDVIEDIIHPVYRDFDIPKGSPEQMAFFQAGSQALADSCVFTNCSTSIYH